MREIVRMTMMCMCVCVCVCMCGGDKGGMSQIESISFQHVLPEHFICKKRPGGSASGVTPVVQRPSSIQ